MAIPKRKNNISVYGKNELTGRRQELLDQVPNYLKAPGLQANKHMFCIDILKMTETEYLEALNKATNGKMVSELWN